jgi:hypothetical protein
MKLLATQSVNFIGRKQHTPRLPMRRNLLTPVLACVLLFGGITASMAQTTTVLAFTNQWSYLITNALPPGGWTNVNYAAAAGWPTGAGPFAYPEDEAMPGGVPAVRTILATNFNDTFVTSFYFRTTFNLPSNPSNLVFTANAVIDDGAVFYVNGRRVQNVRMTTGTVTHNTIATGDGGGDVSARPLDTFAIASSNFVQGANTIAVSVHQSSGTSSDIAFGLELETEVIQPPVIVTQPQSQTVQVGRRAVFEVEATGNFLTYRWYTNGVLIPGAAANTNSYLAPAATLAMDGTVYHVVVSNAVGRVQSVPVVLRVVPDTFGPEALSAFMARSNWIEVRFDEPLLQSTTNSVTNFTVTVLGTGQELTITNVLFASTTRTSVTVRLPTVLGAPTNYVVCARNIRDNLTNTAGGPFVTALTCVPVMFTNVFNVFGFGELWRWNENQWLVGETAPTNSSATVDWKHINYPDDPARNFLWLEGQAPLREDLQFNGTMCETNSGFSSLSRTPITSYMRKRFTVNTNFPANATIMIRHQFDDAAVVYINGRELYRTGTSLSPGTAGLPAGTPGYGTFALSGVDGTCTTVYLPVSHTNINRGQNVVAVELHQANESTQSGHDTFFDMELNVVWPFGPIIPELTITRTNIAGSPGVRLSWSTNAPGWRLESSADPITGWAPEPTTSTNYQTTIQQGGPRRFYRLVND